jgi:hypothetical protein
MALTPHTLVGNREQLSDKQVPLYPDITPLKAFCSEETATNDYFEYTFDQPDAPKPTALLSGQDTTSYGDAFKNRQRFGTYLQEDEVTFGIENRQVSNDPAAIAKQLAAAEMRERGRQDRNIEVVLGSDQAHAAQSGSVAYKAAGLGWYQSTTNTAIPELYRAKASDNTAMASLTNTLIETLMQKIVVETGSMDGFVLFANTALFGAITKAYLNSSVLAKVQFQHQGNRNIDLVVYHVSTAMGSFDLVHAPYLGAASTIDGTAWTAGTTQQCRGYLVRRGVLSLLYKEGQKSKTSYHEDKGAGPRGSIRSIFGLANYAPKGNGMFNATSL